VSINAKQDEIVEEFDLFDQWMDKYEYIIDLGKKLPLIDDTLKIEENLIPGCQSQVWLHARVLSGESPQSIASSDLYFIDQIGLKEHLSPTRSNGLVSMVNKLKSIGVQFSQAQ